MAAGLFYYSKWADLEIYDLILEKLRIKVRVKIGQKAEASLGLMDSQSVRWDKNRVLNGIDGNKKVKGVKRYVVVDKNGFLIAIMVCVANIHDSKAALSLMRIIKEFLSSIKIELRMAVTEEN